MKEKEIEKKIGERIKHFRKEKKFSQEELSQKSGVANSTISSFENGKRSIGLYSLARIAEALGVSLDDLYYGREEERPITKAYGNKAAKIVNCVTELYKEGVILDVSKDGFNPDFEFTIVRHRDSIIRLIKDLQRSGMSRDDPIFDSDEMVMSAKKLAQIDIERNIK